MKSGESVVLRHVDCAMHGFTAYKVYKVCAGEGEVNQSSCAMRLGTMLRHSENTFNIVDDNGVVRMVSNQHFRPFNEEFGLFK